MHVPHFTEHHENSLNTYFECLACRHSKSAWTHTHTRVVCVVAAQPLRTVFQQTFSLNRTTVSNTKQMSVGLQSLWLFIPAKMCLMLTQIVFSCVTTHHWNGPLELVLLQGHSKKFYIKLNSIHVRTHLTGCNKSKTCQNTQNATRSPAGER